MQQQKQISSQLTKNLTQNLDQYLLQEKHIQSHLSVGSFIKSVVYGSMDGVINTTIILLTGVASNTPVPELFSICLSAVIAGALDMGLCDYVSSKSEMQFIKLEEEREKYEMEHYFEAEKKEMLVIYQKRGFNDYEAQRIVQNLATSTKAFLNVMMMEELGLVKEDDQTLPIKCGIATFIAFLTSSFISLFPYIVTWLIQKEQTHPWVPVLIVSTIQLVSLGMAKAKLIGLNPWKSAIQFLLLGIVATSIGFVIGKFFPKDE